MNERRATGERERDRRTEHRLESSPRDTDSVLLVGTKAGPYTKDEI